MGGNLSDFGLRKQNDKMKYLKYLCYVILMISTEYYNFENALVN